MVHARTSCQVESDVAARSDPATRSAAYITLPQDTEEPPWPPAASPTMRSPASSLLEWFDVDVSTVLPSFEGKGAASAEESSSTEPPDDVEVETVVYVPMPPVERRMILLHILAVRDGEPVIVEPDDTA